MLIWLQALFFRHQLFHGSDQIVKTKEYLNPFLLRRFKNKNKFTLEENFHWVALNSLLVSKMFILIANGYFREKIESLSTYFKYSTYTNTHAGLPHYIRKIGINEICSHITNLHLKRPRMTVK